MALLSKNKLKFVGDNISKPNRSDSNFEAWEICNVMVLSWILRTLTPHIAESVVYIDIAQNLGEDLRERFSKGDHFLISNLLQKWHSIN